MKRGNRVSLALAMGVALAAAASSGCSTHYKPRISPRVAITMSGGDLSLQKNGTEVTLGIFGSGLTEAMAGNATATRYAETHESLNITSFALLLVGGVATGAGAGLVIFNATGDNNLALNALGFGTMLGGPVMALVAVFLSMEAQTNFFDAVNAYNDGVTELPRAP